MKNFFLLTVSILFLASCTLFQPTPDGAEPALPTAQPRATVVPATATPVVGKPGEAGVGDTLFPTLGNSGYDVAHYDLALSWDDQTGEIEGTATIIAIAQQNLSGFNLDLHGLTVDSVMVEGAPAEFSREADELIITFPAGMALAEGITFETIITYHGVPKPIMTDLFPIGWLAYESGVFVISEPEGSRSWYPVNDHPADKASYKITVTVPKPFVAVSNGSAAEPIDNGDTVTYSYSEDDPMASYLVTVNIAEYESRSEPGEKSGVPITNYVEKGLPASTFDGFNRQDEILAALIDAFGPYPYDEIGGIVPAVPFGFALETQTLPIYDRQMLERAGDFVVAHELAHQWFGNSLSPQTWDEIWLNEGFATYGEIVWIEASSGRDAAMGYAQTLYEVEWGATVPPGVVSSGSTADLFSNSVYQRGGLTLHALRLTVGDEAFFEILQTYAARFAHGNVTTEDFIAVAEEISKQDLDDLFDAWLYQDELPEMPDG